MAGKFIDFYEVMGLPPSVTQEELQVGFRALGGQLHPDTGSSSDPERFSRVTLAYSTLKTRAKRLAYDKERRLLTKMCLTCDGNGRKPKTYRFRQIGWTTCAACAGTGVQK